MDLSMMVGDVKFNYRVGLLIKRNNKILVEFNPDYDFTTIPGGRVKTLESSFEGLQREIEEEMHIKLNKEEVSLKALIENFFELDNKKYHEFYILYKLDVEEPDKRFTNEMINHDSKASIYKWIDKDKLADANLLPECLRYLKDNKEIEHIIINDLEDKEKHV